MNPRSLLLLLLGFAGASPAIAQRVAAFGAIDAAIEDGIRRGAYPAAVVMVGRRDTVLYARGYGHFTWNPGSRRPDPATTLWDIASLSKVVATTSEIARMVERGQLDLEAPVGRYLPDFRGNAKGRVTLRMLLDHTSGLPAYSALYRGRPTISAARTKLMAIPLVRAPGASALYSDLNAMVAALVVERVAAAPFDDLTRRDVFEPLGMRETLWRPRSADNSRVVPTGRAAGRPIAGTVNDPNARILGGVAGHAGVFSTGLDLAHFAQAWLRVLTDPGATGWLHPATALRFSERGPSTGTRALGWDTPNLNPDDGKPALYGRCATTTTLGHAGWTGTLIWLDPAADLFVVLLTNRSFAPRNAKRSFEQIREVRAQVSDAARRAAGGKC